MKDYKQLIKELPSKTVVFSFGRFNPPTIGHELLIKAVKRLAQQKNADHVIYASKSQDSKKNPLTVDKKVKYLNLMFRNTNFLAADEHVRTFLEAAKQLNKKYKNIIMVAGSDRVPEFKRILNAYNGKEYNFDTIEVISAGERDPDADDATGMSASKMRAIASKGEYLEFKRGLPSTVRDIDGKRLMNDIRDGMGLEAIKEQIVLVKDELREKYFRGEIYNVGDLVESSGDTYTIVKRGSNHLLLKESCGKLTSKWIHDVQPKEAIMNEELTDKTLKTNDKIKVARVIATMLGVDNAETSSNPDNLVNLGLRKVRSKTLNPEALAVVKRMLVLADSVGIKYDASLLSSKLKEGVAQPSGTDRVDVMVDEPTRVVGFNDFKKGKVGNTLHHDDNDQIRKMKIKHHLGESSSDSYEDVCPECQEHPCACDDGFAKPLDPFFAESSVDVSEYEEKWEEHIFADDDPSEEELDHFIHHITDDELYDLYDEDELTLVDVETGEELPEDEEEKELEEESLMEVLSRVERMKAKFRIRKTKAKRERATKIALKRYSNTKTLNKRSRRLAIKMMKKRLLRGRDVSKLSVGEKERVEKIIQTRKKLIDRLAMRLTPRVRKIEKARLSHSKLTSGGGNVAF